MIRKEGIEKIWKMYQRYENEYGGSYLGIGKMSLNYYEKWCYRQYKMTCNNSYEKAINEEEWLNQEIQNKSK